MSTMLRSIRKRGVTGVAGVTRDGSPAKQGFPRNTLCVHPLHRYRNQARRASGSVTRCSSIQLGVTDMCNGESLIWLGFYGCVTRATPVTPEKSNARESSEGRP